LGGGTQFRDGSLLGQFNEDLPRREPTEGGASLNAFLRRSPSFLFVETSPEWKIPKGFFRNRKEDGHENGFPLPSLSYDGKKG